jgi:uncharacterized protein (TIGR00369 family)
MDLNAQINTMVTALKGERLVAPLTPLAKQQSHKHCMLCGSHALLGLKLNFYRNQDEVWSTVLGSIHQQGYQGILHGGFLSALLDAAMCQAIFNQKVEAVTADMNIRFLHEVPTDSEMLIKGEVVSHYSSLYKVKAHIYVENKLMVKADARFMKKTPL